MKTRTLNQSLHAMCFIQNFGSSKFDDGPLRFLRVGSRSSGPSFRLNGPGGKFLTVVAMVCQGLVLLGAADCSVAQPINDNFTDTIPLTNYWVAVTGNNAEATREPGDPTAGKKSVWWSWTAPTSGVYTVTAAGWPGGFQPFLGVYAGTVLSDLTLVASDYDYDDYTARVSFNVVSGVTYRIAISTVNGMGGDSSLSLVPTVPPTVTITHPARNATIHIGDIVALAAEASDITGANTRFWKVRQTVASGWFPNPKAS